MSKEAKVEGKNSIKFVSDLTRTMQLDYLSGVHKGGIKTEKAPTLRDPYSKASKAKEMRSKKIRKMKKRRKAFQKLKVMRKEYLHKLAKGTLEKGEVYPQ